jgi:hypothetical protein
MPKAHLDAYACLSDEALRRALGVGGLQRRDGCAAHALKTHIVPTAQALKRIIDGRD